MLRAILVLPLIGLLGGPLSAQSLGSDRFPLAATGESAHFTVAVQDAPRSTARLVAGSALGWGIGIAGGAALGYALSADKGGEGYFGPAGMWLCGWLGSSVGAAAGAHLANGREGNLLLGSLSAFTVVPLAALATMPLVDSGLPVVVAFPALQVGVSVAVERATARARRR
jgi:hypothetical protein